MRIVQVTAHAFGPLVGETLEFAPGMTVVTGVNESGKSSWHAAVLSSLVGRRRGRGAATREEKRFAEQYRPWHSPEWRVSAIIELDDGRRIELSHDLDGKVDCRATDLDLGRDVSCDIMVDGAPDASRYLGLDRKSFAATAVVRQAELLSILTDAAALQEYLQRAADTAGTDATAAAALSALERFRKEHVGVDRANSAKPLRAARKRLAEAQDALELARREHASYLDLVTAAEQRRLEAGEAGRQAEESDAAVAAAEDLLRHVRDVAQAEAAANRARELSDAAARAAETLAARLARAEELWEKVGGEPPETVAEADGLAAAVAGALATWDGLAPARPLAGPDSAELRRERDALPAAPEGDLEPHPEVTSAQECHARAAAVLAAHRTQEPPVPVSGEPDLAAAIACGPARIRELAARLGAATLPSATTTSGAAPTDQLDAARGVLTSAEAEYAAASAAHAEARARLDRGAVATPRAHRWRPVLLALAGVAALAGVLLVVTGQTGPALAFPVVLAAGLAVAAVALRPAAPHANDWVTVASRDLQEAALRLDQAGRVAAEARRTVMELEAAIAAHDSSTRAALTARAELEAQARAWGLPVDPAALQDAAAAAERAIEQRHRHETWAATYAAYTQDVAAAEDRLRAALVSRGELPDPGAPVADLIRLYAAHCAARAAQDAESRRRPALEQALADRLAAEEAAAEAAERRAAAERTLRQVAAAAGVGGGDDPPGSLVEALRAWQGMREAEMAALAQRQGWWAELQALLEGRTLADLAADHGEAVALSASRSAAVFAADVLLREATERANRAAVAARHAGLEVASRVGVAAAEEVCRAARENARQAHERAQDMLGAAENADGAVAERARTLPSVTQAEEAVAEAQRELDRVTELADTLTLTQEFLTAAQDRVHRDIAPLLASTLREWLPIITAGRYVDASVDPATLEVRVTGPERHWRNAGRLSTGTAEQVYLLLRVALARHLATTGETCPLLLDDVTVQADQERTARVLDLLLGLSAERQIILFAQEPEVAEWARATLATHPRHRIIELDRVSVC